MPVRCCTEGNGDETDDCRVYGEILDPSSLLIKRKYVAVPPCSNILGKILSRRFLLIILVMQV